MAHAQLEVAIAVVAAAAAGVPSGFAGVTARITAVTNASTGAVLFRALQLGAPAGAVARVDYVVSLESMLASYAGALSGTVAAGGPALFAAAVVNFMRAQTPAFSSASALAVAPATITVAASAAAGGSGSSSGVGAGVGAAAAIVLVAVAVIFRARLRALLCGVGAGAGAGADAAVSASASGPKIITRFGRPGSALTLREGQATFDNPARLQLRAAYNASSV